MTDEQRRQLQALQHNLLSELQRRGLLSDPALAAAFAAVPRHLFLPTVAPEQVYSDQAIITKAIAGAGVSSSSQPAMMAIMLQQLQVEPGHRVLEIGAGTGYNAALLQQLVGPQGQVTTVDVDDDIVAAAREHLRAAGSPNVQVLLGDGGYGAPVNAPYDRIMLTVGAADLAPAWREQLLPDGLLVVPLSLGPAMYSVAFRLLPNGTLRSESLSPCGFIRLRGAFASGEQTVTVGDWLVSGEPGPHLDFTRLPELLATVTEETLPEEASTAQLFLSFALAPLVTLHHRPTNTRYYALLDTTRLHGCTLPGWRSTTILRFGAPQGSVALYTGLRDWQRLGRPDTNALQLLALPHGHAPLATDLLTMTRSNTTFVLTGRSGQPLHRPRR